MSKKVFFMVVVFTASLCASENELEKYVIGQELFNGTCSFVVDVVGPDEGYVQGTVLPDSGGGKVYTNPKSRNAHYGCTIEECLLEKEQCLIEWRIKQIAKQADEETKQYEQKLHEIQVKKNAIMRERGLQGSKK